MKKELKNYEILDVVEAFTRIGMIKDFESTKKFSYALIINEEELLPKAKALLKIQAPSKSYTEYENQRNAILAQYGKVDGEGKLILRDNQWVVFEDDVRDEAISALKALDELNNDVLEQRDADLKEYREILNKPVEVDIECVSLDDIPDIIGKNVSLLKQLMPMIG